MQIHEICYRILYNAAAAAPHKIGRILWGDKPAVAEKVILFHTVIKKISGKLNPLLPSLYLSQLEDDGSNLTIPELCNDLIDKRLGGWAIDRHCISFLWHQAEIHRPSYILECGSGISTLVMARWIAHNSIETARLLSLEQDFNVLMNVRDDLERHGLASYVTLIHCPLNSDGDYTIRAETIDRILGDNRLEWIIIDGPSPNNGRRDQTLPQLLPWCQSGTRWFLDDALRDSELAIISQWLRLPHITVEGIYFIGKGIATGTTK